MKRGFWIVICCFFLASVPARGQFFSAGNDPGALRWRQIRTGNYRVIYPAEADSLARAYAFSLQQQYPCIARSIGYEPSELCRTPMSVILHTRTSYGNGMVMWAPRRMELYTVGDANDPDPTPWMLNLTTHEPRHASQLQFGRRRPFGVLRWLVGDLSDVAWWSIYTGIAFSEGDAVVAETGLTPFGRGRTADFLEYVRVAFDEGDWRDYYRWRYGSVKRFTPDHYRAGYMLAAGLRTGWDEPLFLQKYQDNLFSRKLPIPFFNMPYTIRQVTGMSFDEAFGVISKDFHSSWKDNDAWRLATVASEGGEAAFVEGKQMTAFSRRYTAFRGAAASGDGIYAVETGLERAARLVRIDPDGDIRYLGPFAATASDLRLAGGRLYWSEEIRDQRWALAGTAIVRSMDLATGRKQTLLRGCRDYNPAPSEDGSRVAAMRYAFDGSHQIIIVRDPSSEGSVPDREGQSLPTVIPVPAGVQPVQGAWIGASLYVSAVTEEGFGIFEVTGDWRTVLPGEPVKIKQLRARDGRLWFVCDKSGANELYSCDPASGTLLQHSLLRHGGQDFVWNAAGDTLRYTVLSTGGRMFHEVPVSAFTPVPSDWSERWRHPVAEELSVQEQALEAAAGTEARDSVILSEPRPYRKAGHLLHFHSWAPLYVDYDAVSNLSFSSLYDAATLGATAFFQNDLATATGSLGYSAAKVSAGSWRHLVDLRFNYTGWYPVIETSLQVSTNKPSRYQFTHLSQTDGRVVEIVNATSLSSPAASFSARVYVPLSFSSGGWSRGLVPQVRYSISNSVFDGTVFSAARFGLFPDKDRSFVLTHVEPGERVFLQNVTASVRGYAMLPTAAAGVYPRWGIGAELGAGFRPALTHIYDPAVYGYLYGYVPGIVPEHGLRLSGIVQRQWSRSGTSGGAFLAEQRVVTYPRGYAAASSLGRYLADRYPLQAKWTADYMMAILPVDWSGLGPVAYVKNFELGLHADAALYVPLATPSPNGTASGTKTSSNVSVAMPAHHDGNLSAAKRTGGDALMSAGASLSVRLGNLLWVPFDTRIGVDWSYNFGPSYDRFRAGGLTLDRHYFGLLFSVDY